MTPKSFINTEQAFVNQHRILIVYLRYIYFYLLFIMMTKVNGFYVNYIQFLLIENLNIDAETLILPLLLFA